MHSVHICKVYSWIMASFVKLLFLKPVFLLGFCLTEAKYNTYCHWTNWGNIRFSIGTLKSIFGANLGKVALAFETTETFLQTFSSINAWFIDA